MEHNVGWVFIINPIAGNGFAGSYLKTLPDILRKYGIDGEISLTTSKGHATELAETAIKNGARNIVAVGGDGTISEVIQCLVNNKEIVFGAVPAGTGNDFINILGFPERFSDNHWEILFQQNIINMDIGRCNSKYFANGMGLGFDAQVAYENYASSDGSFVRMGAKTKYWWHIIKTLVLYEEKPIQLTTDGGSRDLKTFLNTIAIGRRFAGGFYLTPKALANDGLLDICMFDNLSFIGRINGLLSVIRGTHIHNKTVHYCQMERLLIEFEKEVPAHLDGELYFNSRFDISIEPASLRTIYNPAGKHYFGDNGSGAFISNPV